MSTAGGHMQYKLSLCVSKIQTARDTSVSTVSARGCATVLTYVDAASLCLCANLRLARGSSVVRRGNTLPEAAHIRLCRSAPSTYVVSEAAHTHTRISRIHPSAGPGLPLVHTRQIVGWLGAGFYGILQPPRCLLTSSTIRSLSVLGLGVVSR